jgi:hypothetical protein
VSHAREAHDGSDDLGERVARLEGTVDQIDSKVNWILGLIAGALIALIAIAVKILTK